MKQDFMPYLKEKEKPSIAERVLEILQRQAEVTVDMLGILFSAPPSARARYYYLLTRGPRRFKKDWAASYRERRKFYNVLNYLKRSGLVRKIKRKNEKSGGSLWSLTAAGRKRLNNIGVKESDPYSRLSIDYAPPRGEGLIVVTFDIPESRKKAREWVRASLLEMGFTMLQKSVWVNSGAEIDEDFIHALRERELLDNIHIFSVKNPGTLK